MNKETKFMALLAVIYLIFIIVAAEKANAYMLNPSRPKINVTSYENGISRAEYIASRLNMTVNVTLNKNANYQRCLDERDLTNIKGMKSVGTSWVCQACYKDAIKETLTYLGDSTIKYSLAPQYNMGYNPFQRNQLLLTELDGYYQINLTLYKVEWRDNNKTIRLYLK